jgi:hypothetical protein
MGTIASAMLVGSPNEIHNCLAVEAKVAHRPSLLEHQSSHTFGVQIFLSKFSPIFYAPKK